MRHDPKAAARLIVAGIDKYVMDAARDTIALNASIDDECAGWVRVAGPDACDMCVACASRNDLYHTRTTAGGTEESKYHPYCRCGVVAAFGRGDKLAFVEPETGLPVKLDREEAIRRYEETVARSNAPHHGKAGRSKLLIDDFDGMEERLEGAVSLDELMAITADIDSTVPVKMRKIPAYANLQKVARRKREELKGGGIGRGSGKPPGKHGGNGGGKPPRDYRRPNFHEVKAMQEQSDRVFAMLPNAEREAIAGYTLDDCGPINSMLFGHGDKLSEAAKKRYSNRVDDIKAALQKYKLNMDVIAFKGVPARRYSNLKDGDTYTFDGFMSTSFSHEVASRYMHDIEKEGGIPLMVEIHVPRDTIAMYLGNNTSAELGNEFELLIRNRAVVKVISKRDDLMIWEVVGFE